MLLERFPFWYRAAFLAALMLVAALFDVWRYGKTATRYKEYAFIWFTGLLGCLVGGTTDLITSSISPAYFTVGKGLSDSAGFATRVVLFGIKEGISAGVIAGAVCVYVSRRKSKFPPFGFGPLLRLLWIPVVCAMAGAILLPLLARHSDPAGLESKLGGALSPAPFLPFLRVWWIHTGLYTGLLAGLLCLIAVIGTRRRAAVKLAELPPI